jgi:hypothetical protein
MSGEDEAGHWESSIPLPFPCSCTAPLNFGRGVSCCWPPSSRRTRRVTAWPRRGAAPGGWSARPTPVSVAGLPRTSPDRPGNRLPQHLGQILGGDPRGEAPRQDHPIGTGDHDRYTPLLSHPRPGCRCCPKPTGGSVRPSAPVPCAAGLAALPVASDWSTATPAAASRARRSWDCTPAPGA